MVFRRLGVKAMLLVRIAAWTARYLLCAYGDNGLSASRRVTPRAHRDSIVALGAHDASQVQCRENLAGRHAAKNDPRNQPAYPLSEAARYLKLPAATLRAWTVGRPYPTARGSGQFQPLIRPAGKQPATLSFFNLIEAHVLRALRTEHGVSIKALRQAVAFAERELRIERLLLRSELRSDAGQLFLDRYGQLINLSASGQLAMRHVLDAHLARVHWDRARFPFRLHPFLIADAISPAMPIAIDPAISFGRPVVLSRGVSTATIVERIDAGETPAAVADDYGLTITDVEQAVLYERAA